MSRAATHLLRRALAPVRADALLRTAVPLVVTTGMTSVLGVLYWILAARSYAPADLAQSSATLAVITTLSAVAQLNMHLGLGALLPRAGRAARRLLGEVYVAVTVAGLVLLVGFLIVVLPHLRGVRDLVDNPTMVVVFVVSVLAYSIFALQDAALSALRATGWIPVENTAFGLVKIALVLGLAGVAPGAGILLSWTLPLLLSIVPVSVLIFRVLAPRRVEQPVGPVRLVHAVRPVASDYLGYLFFVASTSTLPALAVQLVGARTAAVFAVTWLISSSLDVVSANIGVAMTVEGSHARSVRHVRRAALTKGWPLVFALSLAVVAASPQVLRLYGHSYAAQGVLLLCLLVAACPARALTDFTLAAARAEGAMHVIVRLQALSCGLVLVGAVVFTRLWGVTGMGAAWLLAQLVTAAVALPVFGRIGEQPAGSAPALPVTTS